MPAVVRSQTPHLGPDAFLAWEEQQDGRHEQIRGEVHAMVGASVAHKKIVLNLFKIFDALIDPESCAVFDETVKLRHDGDLFYPDIMVTCEEYQPGREWFAAPVLLAEVTSPSTQTHDRDRKWPLYQRIPSLQTFLSVAQHRPGVEVFRRVAGGWTSTSHEDLGDRFEVAHAAGSIALRDIYRRVPLPLE